MNEGNTNAELCFYLTKLSARDREVGKPLRDDSGLFFDQALAASNLHRDKVFITTDVADFGKLPNLRVIVPMDGPALSNLLGYDKLDKRRGSIYEYQGFYVIPTLHPSEAKTGRNRHKQHLITRDINRAAKVAKSELEPCLKRKLWLEPSFQQVCDYLSLARQQKRVAFDIESSMHKNGTREMLMFSVAKSATDSICVPLVNHNREARWSLAEETEIMRLLADLLEDEAVTVLIQNASYDTGILYHRYGIATWPVYDTMCAAKLVHPDFPADLGLLTSLYSLQPYFKDTGLAHIRNAVKKPVTSEIERLTAKYSHYVPPKSEHSKVPFLQWLEFQEYSALDSAVLFEIADALTGDMEALGNMPAFQHAMDVLPLQLFMEGKGFAVDAEGLAAEAKKVRAEIKELQADLDEVWRDVRSKDKNWVAAVERLREEIAEKTRIAEEKGRIPMVKGKTEELNKLLHLNVKSTPQKKEFFYGKRPLGQGFPMPKNDPTNEKAVKSLIAKGAKGAKELSTITRLRDDLNKYWAAQTDSDGRVRCDFMPITDNGRFSCRKSHFDTGVNFQNQPYRMKRYMVADEGKVIINADLSQVQYRIVAWEAREPVLMEAFSTGQDAYCAVGARIFDKKPEEVSREKGSSSLGSGDKSERDWAKMVGLATLFGMGANLLSYQLEIPFKDGRWLHDAIQEATPNIWKVYKPEIIRELQKFRFLTNCFGNRRIFLKPPMECLRDALAYKPQRTEQDLIVQRGMLPVWRNDGGFWDRFEICNQVHDSIVMQHPLRNARDIDDIMTGLTELKRLVEQPFEIQGKPIVIPLDFEFGYNCADMEESGLDGAEEVLANCLKERTN